MRFIFSFSLALATTVLAAQNALSPAYVISSDGVRSEVIVLNKDWLVTPESFVYRAGEGKGNITATVDDIQEIGLLDGSRRFKRFTVDIDQSSTDPGKLSESPTPDFTRQTVFLDVLVDGAADLLYYERGEVKRFFLRLGDADPRPLISRSYRSSLTDIQRQDTYRGDLARALSCGTNQQEARQLRYERKPLSSFVSRYNECIGGLDNSIIRTSRKGNFSVGVRPGLERGSITMDLPTATAVVRGLEVQGEIGPRLGVEAEYRLPFANNRWAVFGELYYHSFKGTHALNSDPANTVTARYQSIGIPVGIRHYLYFHENNAVLLNAALVYNSPFATDITLQTKYLARKYTVDGNLGFDFGGGFSFSNRYQLEVRYAPHRGPTDNYLGKPSGYKNISVIAVYRFGGLARVS